MITTDARRAERYDLELPAQLTINNQPANVILLEAHTTDVSAGGAFFRTPETFSIGTPVHVEMILPLDRLKKMRARRARILVTGAVIRKNGSGMAICFDEEFQLRPLAA